MVQAPPPGCEVNFASLQRLVTPLAPQNDNGVRRRCGGRAVSLWGCTTVLLAVVWFSVSGE